MERWIKTFLTNKSLGDMESTQSLNEEVRYPVRQGASGGGFLTTANVSEFVGGTKEFLTHRQKQVRDKRKL